MSDEEDECDLCHGCGEVQISSDGTYQNTDNYGCPKCISREFEDERNDARAEIARLTASYEARLADAYQAVGALIYAVGLSDNADCIRLQDILAYGKTEDGIDLLPWPRDPEALTRDSDIVRLTAERDEARGLVDRLISEAQSWSGEARGHKSTVHEAYQAVTGATGEPGNWHGAQPIIEAIDTLRGALADLQTRHDALLAERAGVSEAAGLLVQHFIVKEGPRAAQTQYGHLELWHAAGDVSSPPDALYNPLMLVASAENSFSLACLNELGGIIHLAKAALSTPIPAPVDRDDDGLPLDHATPAYRDAVATIRARSPRAIRAEVWEEAAKIADGFTCGGCGMDGKCAATIRSAAKTEASR